MMYLPGHLRMHRLGLFLKPPHPPKEMSRVYLLFLTLKIPEKIPEKILKLLV